MRNYRMEHPIKLLRKEKNFTQENVSNRTNLPISLLGRYERSEQIPTYHHAKAIGRVLEVEWHTLIELCEEYYAQ